MSALQRLPATKLSSVLMALALILLLLGVVYTFFPITNDYYYYFRPVAENWLAGE